MQEQEIHSELESVRNTIKSDFQQGFSSLLSLLNHEYWGVRKEASSLLLELGESGLSHLFESIEKESDKDRLMNYCFWAQSLLPECSSVTVKQLEFLYSTGDDNLKKQLLDLIPDLNIREELKPFLFNALGDQSWDVRKSACNAFVSLGESCLPYLEEQFSKANSNQKFWSFKVFAILKGCDAVRYFSKFIKLYPNDEQLQLFAVTNLAEIQDPKIIRTLLNFVKSDSFMILEEVRRSLKRLAKPMIDEFINLLQSKIEPKVLETLLRVLEDTMDASILSEVSFLFDHEDYQTRYLAVSHLGGFPSQQTASMLIQCFSDKKWSIRKLATDKISQLGTFAIPPLMKAIKNQDDNIVFWSLKSLAAIKQESTLAALDEILESRSKELKLLALDVISAVDGEQSPQMFIEAFANQTWEIRQRASELFLKLNYYPVPALLEGCLSSNSHICFWSGKTLQLMGLQGAPSLLNQFKKSDSDPLIAIRNLKLCCQKTLIKELQKTTPSLQEIKSTQQTPQNVVPAQNTIAQSAPVMMASHGGPSIPVTPLPDVSGHKPYDIALKELLLHGYNLKSSDIHIKIGQPPLVRSNSKLFPLKYSRFEQGHIIQFIREILPANLVPFLEANHQADCSYESDDGVRMRINIYKTMRGYEIAGRFITDELPSFETLNLPVGIMQRLCHLENGLIILTGPTGSGKTSTLAAMVDYVNMLFQKHIICIEDPIEYVHHSKNSFVSQREVLKDVTSYPQGIRATLREDPDVILIGELRDRESVETAMTLAGTGHLVLTTLHAPTATTAVEQLQDFFADDQKDHVRKQVAFNMQAIISQRLLRHKNGKTRVPAIEILMNNPAVRNIIRDGKTEQLQNIVETSKKEGMCTLDQSLKNLVQGGIVTLEEAWPHVVDQKTFKSSAQ
jgi:twitching motility protein PilT